MIARASIHVQYNYTSVVHHRFYYMSLGKVSVKSNSGIEKEMLQVAYRKKAFDFFSFVFLGRRGDAKEICMADRVSTFPELGFAH